MSFDAPALRRELHQIPELAFNEHQTKALLLKYLTKLDLIRIHEFDTNPGILVEYTHGSGSYKLFRADMDALPIEEKTACSYESKHKGIMHACGHDIHMAILMGLIHSILESKPAQNLLFLFQPAEEGKGGAEAVLAENIVQSFDIHSVYALHVNPHLGLNQVSARAGIFFAIPQEFDVTFHGKAAHVAFPEEGKDALAAGISFYNVMQGLCQELARDERLIFHIGKLGAGVIRNVIADSCKLEGTHRTLSRAMRDRVNDQIRKQAAICADTFKLDYEIDFLCSYDPVINNQDLFQELTDKCQQLGVELVPSPVYMTGEDFGFFTSKYPGLLFWLGANDDLHDLHSGDFLPDEACIPIGIKLLHSLI